MCSRKRVTASLDEEILQVQADKLPPVSCISSVEERSTPARKNWELCITAFGKETSQLWGKFKKVKNKMDVQYLR